MCKFFKTVKKLDGTDYEPVSYREVFNVGSNLIIEGDDCYTPITCSRTMLKEVSTTVLPTSSLLWGSFALQGQATVIQSTQGSAKMMARWNEQVFL